MMTKLVCWAMVIAGTVLFVGTMWQAARGAMPWAMAFPLMVVQAGFTALNVVLLRRRRRQARWERSLGRWGSNDPR